MSRTEERGSSRLTQRRRAERLSELTVRVSSGDEAVTIVFEQIRSSDGPLFLFEETIEAMTRRTGGGGESEMRRGKLEKDDDRWVMAPAESRRHGDVDGVCGGLYGVSGDGGGRTKLVWMGLCVLSLALEAESQEMQRGADLRIEYTDISCKSAIRSSISANRINYPIHTLCGSDQIRIFGSDLRTLPRICGSDPIHVQP
ncbi:hypothetical protein PIB30_037782 [Stylosanthes scabra]|uniref:Uncharacterized protein n=1 Tax=Stylosanthes scabra TaxID=79078 RepID=A0ABU6XF47_9FABA|nr:hypothetical protein [Stylosanthes scabra]